MPAALFVLAAAAGFSAALVAQEQRMLDLFLGREAESSPWVVFLNNAADVSTIEQKLRLLPGARAVRFIPKTEALEIAKTDPALADGISLVARNPFPDSFEIRWETAWLRRDLLTPFVQEISGWDGVARVGYDVSRLDRVSLLSRLAAQHRLAGTALLWGAVAVGVFLAGRLLFWGRGLRWTELLWDPLIGAAAGAAGAFLVARWVGGFYMAGPAAGAALGALAALTRLHPGE